MAPAVRFAVASLAAFALASTAALGRGDSPLAAAQFKVAIRDVPLPELPREARETLALIRKGGPFPYERDGTVFGNREKLLPLKESGYYREYTVPTPGARDRGARRIVAGRCGDAAHSAATELKRAERRRYVAPCVGAEYYYTDDHYRSFRRIRE